MLQTQTVEPATLALLKSLLSIPILAGYNLVGGTALALQIGHRTSTDIDLFGISETPLNLILSEIKNSYDFTITHQSRSIAIGFINNIKVDIVNYKYRLLRPLVIDQDVRMVSLEDIACMKLAAITGRGKKRDFIDLFYLLKQFSLTEMLDSYTRKYHDGSLQLVLKSLTYFEDAETDESPKLFEEIEWDLIKTTIIKSHEEVLRKLY